jgi:hypothetical protein
MLTRFIILALRNMHHGSHIFSLQGNKPEKAYVMFKRWFRKTSALAQPLPQSMVPNNKGERKGFIILFLSIVVLIICITLNPQILLYHAPTYKTNLTCNRRSLCIVGAQAASTNETPSMSAPQRRVSLAQSLKSTIERVTRPRASN